MQQTQRIPFCCHSCGLELSATAAPTQEATSGLATGPESFQSPACDSTLTVRSNPRFVPADSYSHTIGSQWIMRARTQLDSSTGLDISRNRLFTVTGWPRQLPGQTILEAGSGTGCFTGILVSMGTEFYSFDFSEAVDANGRNNGHNRNVTLFHHGSPLACLSIRRISIQ